MEEYIVTSDLEGNPLACRKSVWESIFTDPLFSKWPRRGHYLYYRDRHTGELMRGEVAETGQYDFLFRFGRRQVWLDKSVIGLRLFDTKEEALRQDRPDPMKTMTGKEQQDPRREEGEG